MSFGFMKLYPDFIKIYYYISLQLTTAMFLPTRNTRIKTEPRIIDTFQNTFYDNKRRMKIKNIRFSLGQQIDKVDPLEYKNEFYEKKESQYEKEEPVQQKKSIFLKKLPQLNFQNKEMQKQIYKQSKQPPVKGKKKEVMLNSILDILKPNSNWNCYGGITRKFASKMFGDCKIQIEPKQYKNQFCQEISHYSSTKHYRTPKILENDLIKFKKSNNIVRRKIFSEDKTRQKQQKEQSETNKVSHDLQKIQIVTFSNKFPLFKKESDTNK